MAAFDPTVREAAEVKLLGNTFEVAEFGAKRLKRLERVQRELQKLDEATSGDGGDEPDEADLAAVRLMCEMVEISMIGAPGLGDALWDAFHLDDEDLDEGDVRRGVTMQYLIRLTRFLQEQQEEQQAVGEA